MNYRRVGSLSPWFLALCGVAFASSACASSNGDAVVKEDKPASVALECGLQAPAKVRGGEAVPVKLRLGNHTGKALFLLGWRSPFEGLFGNDWLVTREGVEIPYQGPMVKRGDPEADDYVSIAPNAAAEAEVEVSLAYEMRQPGIYKITLRGPLMDVTTNQAEVPRPLAKHQPMPIQCPTVQTEVVAP